MITLISRWKFPISRDPPEGGTTADSFVAENFLFGKRFQFLGIPPKGEPKAPH